MGQQGSDAEPNLELLSPNDKVSLGYTLPDGPQSKDGKLYCIFKEETLQFVPREEMSQEEIRLFL